MVGVGNLRSSIQRKRIGGRSWLRWKVMRRKFSPELEEVVGS